MIDPLKDMADGLDWLRDNTTAPLLQLAVSKDKAIAEALQAVQPLWTKDEIARRCMMVRCVGAEREELFVDGRCALVFYPAEAKQEWHDDKLVLTYTQRFKRIVNIQMAANQ